MNSKRIAQKCRQKRTLARDVGRGVVDARGVLRVAKARVVAAVVSVRSEHHQLQSYLIWEIWSPRKCEYIHGASASHNWRICSHRRGAVGHTRRCRVSAIYGDCSARRPRDDRLHRFPRTFDSQIHIICSKYYMIGKERDSCVRGANIAGGWIGGADGVSDWIRWVNIGAVACAGQCAARCNRRIALCRPIQ